MKTAIGTKVIRFEPMGEGEFYEKFKSAKGAVGPGREGYHVQYDNPDGSVYDSWSPKDVFEAAYTCTEDSMSFGYALFFMNQGKKVRRKSWVGDGWISVEDNTFRGMEIEGKGIYFSRHFDEGLYIATYEDLLANDWMIVDA